MLYATLESNPCNVIIYSTLLHYAQSWLSFS
nr:MAG TPA: hypothetical protein [Caudoviricetes sp.]